MGVGDPFGDMDPVTEAALVAGALAGAVIASPVVAAYHGVKRGREYLQDSHNYRINAPQVLAIEPRLKLPRPEAGVSFALLDDGRLEIAAHDHALWANSWMEQRGLSTRGHERDALAVVSLEDAPSVALGVYPDYYKYQHIQGLRAVLAEHLHRPRLVRRLRTPEVNSSRWELMRRSRACRAVLRAAAIEVPGHGHPLVLIARDGDKLVVETAPNPVTVVWSAPPPSRGEPWMVVDLSQYPEHAFSYYDNHGKLHEGRLPTTSSTYEPRVHVAALRRYSVT